MKNSYPKVIGWIDLSKFDKKQTKKKKEEEVIITSSKPWDDEDVHRCGNCGSVLHTSECVCDALNLW